MSIPHSNVEGPGKWIFLDVEFNLHDGEVVGTHFPSGHSLHIDSRFELPNGEFTRLPWFELQFSWNFCFGLI